VLHGDGGGKVPALARALHGRNRVARTLVNWTKQGRRIPGLEMRLVEINGQPGMLSFDGEGRILNAMALDIAEGQVQGVSSIVNPEKLGHLGETADWRSLVPPPKR
jgi:hypothetical protein